MAMTAKSTSNQFSFGNTSSISTIRFHPQYERIIPKLKSEEYQELKSSIAENGLYNP